LPGHEQATYDLADPEPVLVQRKDAYEKARHVAGTSRGMKVRGNRPNACPWSICGMGTDAIGHVSHYSIGTITTTVP